MTAIPGAIQNLRIPQPHHVPADSLQSPPPFTTPVAEPLTPSIKHSYMEEDPSTGQSYREATRAAKRKARRKNETIIASLCQLIVQHQIGKTGICSSGQLLC